MLKVLFVSSGNSPSGISNLVLNQGKSLEKKGVSVSYFLIRGKGIKGYLQNISSLKKYLSGKDFDLVHSHYAFSSMVASLGSGLPVVASLMGSDISINRMVKLLVILFNRFSWKATIVKSRSMAESISLKNVHIIPNGIDLDRFKPIPRTEALKKTGFRAGKKNLVLIADPGKKVKNVTLAVQSVEILNRKDLSLHIIQGKDHDEIPFYINSADVLVLSSLREGSPNVVKEAMACGIPVVSTDVGDVNELFDGTEGYFISRHDPHDMAMNIKKALDYTEKNERTKGRERIRELGLGSDAVAARIMEVYADVAPGMKRFQNYENIHRHRTSGTRALFQIPDPGP